MSAWRCVATPAASRSFLKEPQDLRFVVFNKAGEELLGYDRKDLLGKNNLNLFPPEQAAHFMAKDREVLTEGALVDIPEESITTAKKGLRTLHTRKVCLKGPDGTAQYLLGISEDITERKRAEAEREKLEEQLRASQRLDSIGSLVGGIAHDFNNLLSIILSYTSFAIAKTSGKLRDELLEVERAGERAAALTKQLLAFSSRQVLEPEPTKLNFIVSDIEKMLRRILGEDIEFEMALWPNLGSTLADPGKLEQVLMNLVVNARDAMPKGGRLRLETSHLELDESASSIVPSIEPGRYVCLAVSDTGCGMDKETMARIFEPFFTTKAPGKGTGLGLPTVYGIVKQSGGGIAVTSATGQGTTFRVYLKHLSEAESEAWPKRGVRSTTKTRESEPPSLVPAKGPPLSPQWQEEAELRNSQKLEAIGGLAAGIAHEINTPAQYVSDSLHFLMEACGAQKQLAASHRSAAAALSEAGGHETLVTAMRRLEEEIDLDYLEENVPQSLTLCRDGLARISSIVEALKSFSQKGTHDRAPADLNAALQTTLTVCRNEYKYVAEIETDLGELPLVSCNLGDVNQVFLSLIVNAAQAVADAAQPRGGMGKIRVTSRTDGRNVRINISDTGAGIPEAIRGRVFEPFFTTKPVGRGVGQSLAIARSIVEEQHGGRLTFESTVGMGTTFTLELPSEPLEGPGAQSLLPGQGAEKGRPRILVIDDEPPLGVAMGRVLRHEFEVVLATGGAQALDLVASDQSFDVLLCDLHMPEMSGMDFHDRLLARWPQLASRIVFMSGGASTARAQDFLGSVHRPWLSKPVEPAALVSTVRSMLADKRSP
ncbi:MAG: ATP-binding protein [Myxococcota bacterium]|nr:ATP-binding protein [Myxococcota bacterium]